MPPADPTPAGRGAHGPTRRLPTVLLVIAGVLLAARIAVMIYDARTGPRQAEGLVQWHPIGAGEVLAREQGRPILYDFTAEWCGPCKVLEREVFAHRESATFIEQSFVPIRVLDRQREEGRNPPDVAALQARYKVRAFPTLVVVRADGTVAERVEGYVGRNAVMFRLSQARMQVTLPTPTPR